MEIEYCFQHAMWNIKNFILDLVESLNVTLEACM
jgi:hypothetical protein